MNTPILVTRSSMPDYEEYCAEIRKFWDSHWLTNMGVEHETLQSELEKYLASPRRRMVSVRGASTRRRAPGGS